MNVAPNRRSLANVLLIAGACGPLIFAALFYLDMAIDITFFDPRSDRPFYEYAAMLTFGGFLLFLIAFANSFLAFIGFAVWLFLSSKIQLNLWLAAALFAPVVVFIICRIGFWPTPDPDQTSPLIFGMLLIFKFPLSGFLLIAVPGVLSMGCCCWLLSKQRRYSDNSPIGT